jgi:hypothetical protein
VSILDFRILRHQQGLKPLEIVLPARNIGELAVDTAARNPRPAPNRLLPDDCEVGRAHAEQAPSSHQQKLLGLKKEVIGDLAAAAKAPKRGLRNPGPRHLPAHFILPDLQKAQDQQRALAGTWLVVAALSGFAARSARRGTDRRLSIMTISFLGLPNLIEILYICHGRRYLINVYF